MAGLETAMYLLVLDTETTGLPEDKEAVMIELACALYSVERKTTVWQLGAIMDTSEDGLEKNPCEHINGITSEDLHDAVDPALFHEMLFQTLTFAGPRPAAVLAHNADFDKEFCTRAEFVFPWPWVDSVGFEYDRSRGSKHLSHLAADYGLPGHRQSHRALDDVILLCQLLSKLNNLEEQVQDALLPQGLWKAGVNYNTKELAKAQGFHWDGPNKRWIRRWPINKPWPKDLPFRVTLIEKL